MGINGLLPLLKSIHKSRSLKSFDGKTLGVDAYGWLHRGTVACAMELATGKPTRKFVDFAMHRVRMLQHFGVTPFLIFDGDYLPSKAATETDRAKRRRQSRKLGLELLRTGKPAPAYLEFQKSIDVTPEMARQLIDELKKTGVQYIVAPYEADAQIVYLERKGIIDGIISEDSDLLVFGAKCLLTKLDQYGNCIEANRADFSACRDINLTGWSDTEFRWMAILSGCDYLASINNMGLKTAHRMIRKHKTIEKVIQMLQFDGKFHVPKGYLEAFQQAELTFLHQRVFCPKTLTLVYHTEPEKPIADNEMPFIGALVESHVAQGVARGDLNPITKRPIVITHNGIARPSSTSQSWSTRDQQKQAAPMNVNKGVPIETFFKNKKRTPLAELDPNCCTPSPSQQQALERNLPSWMASPAPRQYLSHSEPASELPQSGTLQWTQIRHTSRSLIDPEPRPSKRARLCSEVDPLQDVDLGPSRFFPPATFRSNSSPSLDRERRVKRNKNQDVYIFSDDSIEEVMLNLPDLRSSENQPAYQEEQSGNIKPPEQDAMDQVTRSEIVESQGVLCAAARVSRSGPEEQPVTPLEVAPLPPMEELKGRFIFSEKSTEKSSGVSHHLPTPSSACRQSRIPRPKKSTVKSPKSYSTKPKLTPLQRLGFIATSRSKLADTPPDTPVYLSKHKPPCHPILTKTGLPFPEVEARPTKQNEHLDFSLPLTMPVDMENLTFHTFPGSEDLIIHDSDSDEEPLLPTAMHDNHSPRRPDLMQFVCTVAY